MAEKLLLRVQAQITKIVTMADKSIRLQVDTQEISNENITELMKLRNTDGYFVFSDVPIQEEDLLDIPEVVPEFKTDKSPSQRLRARLYVYYKETHSGNDAGFEDYYKKEMDKIGQHYLDKINNSI